MNVNPLTATINSLGGGISFPTLPSTHTIPELLGSSGSGGIGIGTGNPGLTIGINPTGGSGGGGVTPVGAQNSPSSNCGYNPICYLQNLFSSTGDLLLRLVFLILGLMCIAGAIYLYKPTQSFITVPLGAAKRGVKAAATEAAAA